MCGYKFSCFDNRTCLPWVKATPLVKVDYKYSTWEKWNAKALALLVFNFTCAHSCSLVLLFPAVSQPGFKSSTSTAHQNSAPSAA